MRKEKRERETEGVRRKGRKKGGQEREERRGERLFTKKIHSTLQSTAHYVEIHAYMYK